MAHYAAINQDRIVLSRRAKAESDAEYQRQKQAIQDWLSTVSCEDIHNDLRELRKRFPGTTEWIYQSDPLRRWMSGQSDKAQLFWLSGIPGAGKLIKEKCASKYCVDVFR